MKVLYIDCFAGFTSEMLLGALIDMGASPSYIESALSETGAKVTIDASVTKRSKMECTLAKVTAEKAKEKISFSEKILSMAEKMPECTHRELCVFASVICAIEYFDADYIMCSEINDGYRENETVYNILKNANIPINSLPTDKSLISCEGAVFLSQTVNECDILPLGNVKSVGYGAGSEDFSDIPNIVRSVLTETEEEPVFFEVAEQLKL